MRRLVVFAVWIIFAANTFAIGPVDVSGIDADGKRFWDSSVVVTGVVEDIDRPEKGWVVLTVRPTSLISGNIDPGTHSAMKVGYVDALLNHFPTPREGERILMIVQRKPAEAKSHPPLAGADKEDFGLPPIRVMADIEIGPISILDDKGNERIEALLKRIRAARAYKAE
jgi:hypothetical protein